VFLSFILLKLLPNTTTTTYLLNSLERKKNQKIPFHPNILKEEKNEMKVLAIWNKHSRGR